MLQRVVTELLLASVTTVSGTEGDSVPLTVVTSHRAVL